MLRNILFIAFSLFSAGIMAQNGSIKGNIKTADSKPAEFVNISVKGSAKGSVTDKEGNFLISNLKPGTYQLVASFVGASKQEQSIEVKANEVSLVNFTLDETATALSEITVTDARINKYYRNDNAIVAKQPLKDLENPQVYNSISKEILADQVVTNFNDALKNATGITRLWESTGRGGDGAEFFSLRGFAVQPSMVNGLPSVNNGGLDPINIETIDVIKGPSGTLFGSPLISYGGLINVTTKRPYESLGGELTYISGSNALNRFTADVNLPLSEQAFARINTAYHSENSFQDAGFKKSIFIAPSFKFKANEKLTFLINTEFMNAEAANPAMLFLSRYSALSFTSLDIFEKYYSRSFTSNDLSIKNPTVGLQAQALYKLSDAWTSQTVISRSSAKTDGYYHYLWDFSDGNTFGRYISKRNGETNTTDIQQNFIGNFSIGNIENKVLIGFDYFSSAIHNASTGWLLGGTVTLADGVDTGILTKAAVDNLVAGSSEGVSTAESEVISAYVSDVINITPALSVLASIRFDQFGGKTSYYATDDVKDQSAFSPKFGIVYQVLPEKLSVFGNYLNGFTNVGPTQIADIDGSNPRLVTFDPEQANQYEFGVKSNLLNGKLSATASYYNIAVKNRVMVDPNNQNNSIQGGEAQSTGFEVSLIANPIEGLNIIAGFSNNDSEIVKDNPGDGYIGLRPEEAGPAQLANFWLNYTFSNTAVKGLGFGLGGNYASDHKTLNRANTGTFVLPEYTVLNAALSYTGDKYGIILKVNNLTDKQYYSGWSTVTPQNLRNISLSLNYKF
ncbi:TonB-dependent receptor [Chryseotalea sanaruensis]|nr:TonB-dependent receptor [Chryseotalea sanaruensis]